MKEEIIEEALAVHVDARRPWLVFLSALVLASLATAAGLVERGARAALQLAEQRLGADILVVPAGAEASVESALLTGGAAGAWMPEDYVQQIAAIAGVAAVSPQLYLSSSAQGNPSAPELLLIACDPARDPALSPWLSGPAPGSLALASAVGGSSVALPVGEDTLWLYGSPIRLAGRLAPTGTRLDRSLFLTFETAHQIARHSYTLAARPLELPLTGITVALVRVRPASDPPAVARAIELALPGISAVPRADLFLNCRTRLHALRRAILAALAAAAATNAALLLLPATRRGLPRRAGRLAASSAVLGIALAVPATCLLHGHLAAALDLPLCLPPLGSLLALAAGSLAIGAGALAGIRSTARRHVARA